MFRPQTLLAVALAASLAACGTAVTTTTSHKRVEHRYAFAKPVVVQPAPVATPAPAPAPAVVVTPPPAPEPATVSAPPFVYFDFDSYALRTRDLPVIEDHANWLKAHTEQTVRLSGHTDVRGSNAYNLELGRKRVEAVSRRLQALGVPSARIETVSHGEERLADTGRSPAAHQRNRRVEFEYR